MRYRTDESLLMGYKQTQRDIARQLKRPRLECQRYPSPISSEGSDMFRPSPVCVPKVTNLSHSPDDASAVTIDTPGACPKLDAVGADVHAAPLAHAALSNGPSDIDIGDWDELFHAVTSRLRLTVGEPLAATPEAQAHDAAGGIQIIVLECVAALDQLHAALTHERSRREQLEREVFNVQAALARARANSPARRPQIACSPASASLPISQQHQQAPLS